MHGIFRSDEGLGKRKKVVLAPPFIVSLNPPGLSLGVVASLHSRFRFPRQDHGRSGSRSAIIAVPQFAVETTGYCHDQGPGRKIESIGGEDRRGRLQRRVGCRVCLALRAPCRLRR